MPRHTWIILTGLLLTAAAAGLWLAFPPAQAWNDAERTALRGLWLESLPPLPADPSNRVADNPQAAGLGRELFFDPRLSANGQVSCATCHQPENNFQDSLPLGRGVGTANRRTMPLAGTAYYPWLFWDGRADSLWAQALGPLENPLEHSGDRTFYAQLIVQYYRPQYQAVFGPLPELASTLHASPNGDEAARAAWAALSDIQRQAINRIYANVGKAIAAYERTLMPTPSRFDTYIAAALKQDSAAMRQAFTPAEEAGLRLFIDKAQCIRCHNGPLLTDMHFHNTGVPSAPGLPEDTGRKDGLRLVLASEFNCLGPYSDAAPQDCGDIRFVQATSSEMLRAYKPPSLRSVAQNAPYMHAGQFATLEQVLRHYNTAAPAAVGHNHLNPLALSDAEIGQLLAFLSTLSPAKN